MFTAAFNLAPPEVASLKALNSSNPKKSLPISFNASVKLCSFFVIIFEILFVALLPVTETGAGTGAL